MFSSDTINQDEFDLFNEVMPDDQVKDAHKEYVDNANKLRDKHRDLKESFDSLEQKTAQGKKNREFIEPKVIQLWNTAVESNFTAKELAALKVFYSFFYSFQCIASNLNVNKLSIQTFNSIFRKSYFILNQNF